MHPGISDLVVRSTSAMESHRSYRSSLGWEGKAKVRQRMKHQNVPKAPFDVFGIVHQAHSPSPLLAAHARTVRWTDLGKFVLSDSGSNGDSDPVLATLVQEGSLGLTTSCWEEWA